MFSDLVNTPKADERAIMTYVSCYYHAFQGAQQVIIRPRISMDPPLAQHFLTQDTRHLPYCKGSSKSPGLVVIAEIFF